MAEFMLEDLIWRNALAVIPLALIAAVICRCLPCRPTTRHALWLMVLLSLVVPPMLPRPSASGRVPAHAYPLFVTAVRYSSDAVSWLNERQASAAFSIENEFAPAPLREHVPDELANWLVNPRSAHIDVVQVAPAHANDTESSFRQRGRSSTAGRGETSDRRSRGTASIASPQVRAVTPSYRQADRDRAATTPQNLFDAQPMPVTSSRQDRTGAMPRGRQFADDHHATTATPVRSAWSDQSNTIWSNAETQRSTATIKMSSSDASASDGNAISSDAVHDSASSPARTIMPAGVGGVGGEREGSLLPAWMVAAGQQMGGWMEQLGRVRDAIAAIPPPPLAAWLTGLVILLVALVMRAGRYRRVIRTAEPAPFDVQMLVQRIAKELELRRVPDVRMIDACVAPMVWCGARPRLILPRRLWAELDVVGRRTVICHELAHVRRRDHWVCRIDLIIGLLYWWHPVVWFVRRRLREEAEYCCDAWVTSLLPHGRRAYAQALLQTRTYTAGGQPAPNALALTVTAPRARRFARRLAMVMTQRHRPGMTLQGLLLVCTLGVLGYVAAPMVACPPDEKKQEKNSEPSELLIPVAGSDRADLAPEPSDEGLTTFEQFMLQQNGQQPEPDQDTQKNIQDIEQRIERLQERIGNLLDSIEPPAPPSGLRIEVPDAPMLESQMICQDALRRALEGMQIEFDDCTPSRARRVTGRRDNCTPSRSRRVTHHDNCTPSRARRVTRVHDNCTPNRGNVLSFTITTTDANDTISRAYHLSAGKLRDLTRLMARSDVPVWITRHNDHIEVQGTPAQHRVFESFVRLIETGEVGSTTVYTVPATGSMDEAVNLSYINAIEAQHNRGCSTENVNAIEAQVRSLEERSRSFQNQSREIERYAEQLRRQAEQVRRQAERLEQQFEEHRSQIEEVEERARELNDLARFNLMSEAHVLQASAQTVRSESNRLSSYADLLENQADSFDDQVDNASDQSDRYEDLADELRELAEKYRERE